MWVERAEEETGRGSEQRKGCSGRLHFPSIRRVKALYCGQGLVGCVGQVYKPRSYRCRRIEEQISEPLIQTKLSSELSLAVHAVPSQFVLIFPDSILFQLSVINLIRVVTNGYQLLRFGGGIFSSPSRTIVLAPARKPTKVQLQMAASLEDLVVKFER